MGSDSVSKQIVFKDLTSAVYVGETYIKRSNVNLSTIPRPLIKIQYDLNIRFRQYIELGSFFKLTFAEEGWTVKIFEVYELRRNEDQQNINIVGYEVINA